MKCASLDEVDLINSFGSWLLPLQVNTQQGTHWNVVHGQHWSPINHGRPISWKDKTHTPSSGSLVKFWDRFGASTILGWLVGEVLVVDHLNVIQGRHYSMINHGQAIPWPNNMHSPSRGSSTSIIDCSCAPTSPCWRVGDNIVLMQLQAFWGHRKVTIDHCQALSW